MWRARRRRGIQTAKAMRSALDLKREREREIKGKDGQRLVALCVLTPVQVFLKYVVLTEWTKTTEQLCWA